MEDAPALADVLDALAEPIPERLLESKPSGAGSQITYIPWHQAQKMLNHYTGGFWEYEVTERERIEGDLYLTVQIIIHCQERSFARQGTGSEDLEVDSYGDPQSNAESQAFRRACARFGLGLHLYE